MYRTNDKTEREIELEREVERLNGKMFALKKVKTNIILNNIYVGSIEVVRFIFNTLGYILTYPLITIPVSALSIGYFSDKMSFGFAVGSIIAAISYNITAIIIAVNRWDDNTKGLKGGK